MKSAPSLILFANHRDQLVRAVGPVGIGQHMLFGIVADGVFVTADNSIALPLTRRRGPGISASIDGVAHGGIGGARAFGAHVALRCESGHQIVASGERRGMVRCGTDSCDGLQVFRAWMQEQVHVRVDQAGQQSGVAEIDDLRVGGWFTTAPAAAMRSPWTNTSPVLTIAPVSISSNRAACSTMVHAGWAESETAVIRNAKKRVISRSSVTQELMNSVVLRRDGLQHLLHFRLVLLQQMLVRRLEAHYQHGLRVGCAQQAPAIAEKITRTPSTSLRVLHLLLNCCATRATRSNFDIVRAIDPDFGSRDHFGNARELGRKRLAGLRATISIRRQAA